MQYAVLVFESLRFTYCIVLDEIFFLANLKFKFENISMDNFTEELATFGATTRCLRL